MKSLRYALLTIALLALALGGSVAYADELIVKIQFPFTAAGVSFPAGKYSLETSTTEELHGITIRNLDTGTAKFIPFLTRVSERDVPEVVFDKKDDQYFLSEIYLMGVDGFQVAGATGKHTHVKVPAGGK